VIFSAFFYPGVALAEGHTVIQLTTDVLTEYYKPYGSLFDACSNGQLLLLSQRGGRRRLLSPHYSHGVQCAKCFGRGDGGGDIKQNEEILSKFPHFS